jgi:hypothetical protein
MAGKYAQTKNLVQGSYLMFLMLPTGYFITYGNDIVDLADRETATLLGNTAIVGGLTAGSVMSIVIKNIFF